MLDEVRRRIDDAGNENLVVGNLDVLQIFPFMVVAWIGGFDAERRRERPEGNVDDFGQRQVVSVWSLVVAPADMQPHAVDRQASRRSIERFEFRKIAKRNIEALNAATAGLPV